MGTGKELCVDGNNLCAVAANSLADSLIQSVFLEMFGEPSTNPMKWKVEKVSRHIKNIDMTLDRHLSITKTESHLSVLPISNRAQ